MFYPARPRSGAVPGGPGARRALALVAALCSAAAAAADGAAVKAPRPHMVYFLADDLGWGDVGFRGSEISTPHLDRLAATGTQLDAFYVQAVCSPTRAALLTGRYPIRYGLQTGVVQRWSSYGLPLEEHTLPQALREAGYRTVLIGKWHLGAHAPEYLPRRRGFDYHYGFYTGAIDYHTHKRGETFDWHRNGQPSRDEGYVTHLLAREAVRVVEQHDAAQPLFLYVAFSAPHTPLQAPPQYIAPYTHLGPKRRVYAGMVAAMDEAIGQIVAAVDRRGLRADTLFIFSSDNGGDAPGEVASNLPLRGKKGTLYEGGVRVPAVVTWPGRVPAGAVRRTPVHVVDWYPTLLRLAGASLEQPLPIDGRDAWPVIVDGQPSPHEVILINSARHHGAVRMGDWKLVLNGHLMDTDAVVEGPERVELFNLAHDPFERRNVADAEPEKARVLRARLKQFAGEATPAKYQDSPPPGWVAPRIAGDFGEDAQR